MKKIVINKINVNKLFAIVLLSILYCQPSEAQFFFKLINKVNTQKTGNTLKQSKVDPSMLPKTYFFNWRYTLQLEHKMGTMKFHRYLNEREQYFASKPEMEKLDSNNMLMVIDPKLNVTINLMVIGNKKIGSLISLSPEIIENDSKNSKNLQNYDFKKIGTKEILGYECEGFEVSSKDFKVIMYIAPDAPVSFNKMTMVAPENLPKGLDPKWFKKVENGLMMEIQIEHKKKKKLNATMTCVALEQEYLEIKISEYEFPNWGNN